MLLVILLSVPILCDEFRVEYEMNLGVWGGLGTAH